MLITLGWVGLFGLIAWCLLTPARGAGDESVGVLWWLVTAAVLLCFRWALVHAPFEFNPDEGQLLAGALTLRHDPVFWRSVDGFTAGPLDFYPLIPATFAGGLNSFTAERLTGLAGTFGAWVFAGEALALLAGRLIARAVVLPALAAYVFTTSPDFLYYSTEIAPVFLLSMAVWLFAKHVRRPTASNLWSIGLVLGAVPWSKLQATPLAGTLWLVVAIHESIRSNVVHRWSRNAGPRTDHGGADSKKLAGSRLRVVPILLLAGIIPSLAFGAVATVTGQVHHLIISYVLNNFGYVQAAPLSLAATLSKQWGNATVNGTLGFWMAGILAFTVISLFIPHKKPMAKAATVVALLLVAAALLAIAMPRRDTGHYLIFLSLPLMLCAGAALVVLCSGNLNTKQLYAKVGTALFLAAVLAPQLIWARSHPGPLYETDPTAASPARAELSRTIRQYAHSGEPLGVWGWASALYIDTGMYQATREGQTQPQINAGRWRSYFLKRYMEDLNASDPPVFVDTVGTGNYMVHRSRAHESFPSLTEFLDRRYTFVEELGGMRIYVRKDRLLNLESRRAH
ncbi:MAG: hypothetical protein ABIZ04_14390 [Opitutus sp.]